MSLKQLLRQIRAKGIRSEKVLQAMSAVEREKFVPLPYRDSAYEDAPLPIGSGQTISQPYIVAFMTEQLDIEPSDRILEIGTGCGYQLAVLAQLTPHVYSVEKREELVETARRNLAAAGCDTVNIKQGDGYEGWEEYAPFDKIMATAAAVHVPPPLIRQLAPGGRMILPVGGSQEIQSLVLLQKDENGEVNSKFLESVRFVPMVGRAQEDGEPFQ